MPDRSWSQALEWWLCWSSCGLQLWSQHIDCFEVLRSVRRCFSWKCFLRKCHNYSYTCVHILIITYSYSFIVYIYNHTYYLQCFNYVQLRAAVGPNGADSGPEISQRARSKRAGAPFLFCLLHREYRGQAEDKQLKIQVCKNIRW